MAINPDLLEGQKRLAELRFGMDFKIEEYFPQEALLVNIVLDRLKNHGQLERLDGDDKSEDKIIKRAHLFYRDRHNAVNIWRITEKGIRIDESGEIVSVGDLSKGVEVEGYSLVNVVGESEGRIIPIELPFLELPRALARERLAEISAITSSIAIGMTAYYLNEAHSISSDLFDLAQNGSLFSPEQIVKFGRQL